MERKREKDFKKQQKKTVSLEVKRNTILLVDDDGSSKRASQESISRSSDFKSDKSLPNAHKVNHENEKIKAVKTTLQKQITNKWAELE